MSVEMAGWMDGQMNQIINFFIIEFMARMFIFCLYYLV